MDEPIIVEKQELTLCGVERHIGGKQSERADLAKAMWQELEADGTLDRLRALSWEEKALALVNRNFQSTGYDRMICALCPEAAGFDRLTLPAGVYAVFTAEDMEAADKLWDQIYFKWFRRSGYDHSGGSEVEIFYPDRVEIWVPVKEASASPTAETRRRGEFWPQLIFMIAGLLLGSVLGRGAQTPAVYMVGGVCVGALAGWLWGRYKRRNDKGRQHRSELPEKKEDE